MMNLMWPLVQSFIRQGLMAAGAVLVAKGYFTTAGLTDDVGAVMMLISSGWSIFNTTRTVKTP